MGRHFNFFTTEDSEVRSLKINHKTGKREKLCKYYNGLSGKSATKLNHTQKIFETQIFA